MANHFVSISCQGEKCRMCQAPATHKVGEEIPLLMPVEEADAGNAIYSEPRHNYTAYLCCEHFSQVMGPFVREYFCELPMEEGAIPHNDTAMPLSSD